jgi:2,3,4,5-tetrahydropyridine-2-carboxylate N-succinyltransferase
MTLPAQYTQLKDTIETAFENRANFTAATVEPIIKEAINTAVTLLDKGELRIAEKTNGQWHVHQWLKKAVLLYFKIHDSQLIGGGYTNFYDKVPLKYTGMDASQMAALGTRVVPHALVRKGAFVAPNCILMPSYINIGAYVDTGTLIDTWATVGSCAQIGKNVHLSGGAGIGGVLEPLQANPTIIEDNCFIGARSEIVEGVIIETGAVIGMGVFIGASTRIYNRTTGEITYGRVPAGSVVVSGNLPAEDGSHSLYCAVIVKQVDEKTRAKTSLNELLRV